MLRTLRLGFSLAILASAAIFAHAAIKPNLILITLDATRADRMGFLGAEAGLTRNSDRLAAESVVF